MTRLRIGHLGLPTLLAGVGLVVVLMIATCLRMAGIAYDRPYVYYPDEWAIAKPAMQIVSSGDPDPHSFTYPTLLIYAETGVVEAVHAVSGVSLVTATPQGAGGMAGASGTDFQTSQFPYVMWGRRLVALMGVLTCLLVALGGRWAAGGGGRREWASGAVQPEDGPGAASARAEGVATENEDSDRAPAIGQGDRGWFAGVAGAAFMAVAVLPLGHSRNLTTDVPCSLFTAATMAITLAALARPPDRTSDRLLILAGFLAGLAASTKYNAAVVGVVPLIGYMIHAGSPRALGHWLPDAIRRKTPYLILAAAAAGFVIATPMILFDASGVLGGLRDQVVHYNVQGHVGAQGDSAGYYVDYLWNIGFGPVLSILSLAGVAWALLRRRASDLVLVVFPLLYFVLVSIPVVRFERNLLPLVPFVALLAGRFVADAAAAIQSRIGRRFPSLGSVAVIGLLALLAVQPLGAARANAQTLSLPDTRTIALTWVDKHLAPGSPVVREEYTPQLSSSRYRVGYLPTLSHHDLAWYRSHGFRYAIASSGMYERFLAPEYPQEAAFYRSLFAGTIVYEVGPSDKISGPTIAIIDLEPGS